MDFTTIVFKVVDLPLVLGIVVIIQMLKKAITLPSKVWAIVMIVAGFFAAFLKVDLKTVTLNEYVIQGIIYCAAAEFSYQSYRTLKDSLHKEKK